MVSDCAFFLVMTSTNFGHFHQGLTLPQSPAEGPELWLQGCCAGPHVQSGKEGRRRPLFGTLRVRQESKDVFCGCSESAGLWY